MKSRAAKRKEAGLCCSCNEPAIPNEVRCEACKIAQRRRNKDNYEKKKSEAATKYADCIAFGVCPKCRNAKKSSESVYCDGCLDEQRKRQQRTAAGREAEKAEIEATERASRKAQGVCLDCGDDRHTKFRCRRCFSLYLIREKGHTRHEAKKKAGICVSCDALSEDGVRCSACKAKRTGTWFDRKVDGLCGICGNENDREGVATCSGCSKAKVALYAERKEGGLCPHCGSDEPISPGKHCKRCRKVNRKKDRRKHRKLQAEVLESYGGVCKCCGEDEPAFLQVDHVNNDGAAHRRKLFGSNKNGCGLRFYTWLRKSGFPKEGFQLLCANCNLAKARYGQCPHQLRQ